jgi:hypothetical protein
MRRHGGPGWAGKALDDIHAPKPSDQARRDAVRVLHWHDCLDLAPALGLDTIEFFRS